MIFFRILILTFCFSNCFSQLDSTSILFYNVENLFDITDDSLKNDKEFLPESKKHWNKYKWNEKTTKIAKVIAANNYPSIIGLAEIENISVLEKLAQHYILKQQNYSIIHFESSDLRGIDCALLYKPNQCNLLSMKPNPVILKGRPTRDILSATFIINSDTLVTFVNHWPSRYGGKKKSIPKRAIAAQTLLHLMDSVSKNFPSRKIISMGDFNDEPSDSSLSVFKNYINRSSKFKGTLRYRGKWQVFDQFIVSKNLKYASIVFKPEYLLEEDKSYGGLKPNRSYYGPMYHGGFSDHLPIKLTFYAP